jgi:hypothetical protein
MAAAEVSVGLHVTDHGFDGGAAPEFAFDEAEDAPLLSGDEDAPRIGRVVAAISLVDIAAFDGAAGETLGRWRACARRRDCRAAPWHLKGRHGDANAILTAAGHNFRLVLAWLRQLLLFILVAILNADQRQTTLKSAS